ncbi:MAG: radical SAM protein [Planctomycetota bacterium]|nr:MAG: radical SAM protein [Planctomycetota bacterium]
MQRPRLRLAQLPVPQPAADSSTGNVALAAACLAEAAAVHGLDRKWQIDLVAGSEIDRLGDRALVELLAAGQPELLGFSLYLWNVERSLHLARQVKLRSPETKILVGGPEVSADNPFLLSQEGIDWAVSGEAEDVLGPLLQSFGRGRGWESLPGVAAARNGRLGSFGPDPTANFPLQNYPSPYLSGKLPISPAESVYVETVRGCRSHCTFCFYPRSSNMLRALDMEDCARLFAHLKEQGAQEVVFLDPTFNHRPEFEALLDLLKEINHDGQMNFFGEIRAEGFLPHHAEAMAQAGFTKVEIGLQSINRETLRRTRRGGHPDQVAKAAGWLQAQGVEMLVDLIVGLPGDRREDVIAGVDFLQSHQLDQAAQVFLLSVLPGTAMRAQAEEDGLHYQEQPPYRVVKTDSMTQEDLAETFLMAEERLDRRLDEFPRPLLVDPEPGRQPIDVHRLDLDREASSAGSRLNQASAFHTALWLLGADIDRHRDAVTGLFDRWQQQEGHSICDWVLFPQRPFPLELLADFRRHLDRLPATYLSRWLAHRDQNAQRRLLLTIPLDAEFPTWWLKAAETLVPVYREMSFAAAWRQRRALALEQPAARVVGPLPPKESREFQQLAAEADPEGVCFADRSRERDWIEQVLGYGVRSAPRP